MAKAEATAAVHLVPELSARDFPVLQRTVRDYADAMGLRDWEFEIMHDPPDDEDLHAKIRVHEGRKYARLWFCCDFRSLTDEFQRHVIVHELVHIHLAEMGFIFRTLSPDLGLLRFGPISDGFERAEEKAVDALSAVIASALPLIEWGK